MSKKEFSSKMKKIKIENESKERKELLRQEKQKYNKKTKIETHKFLAFYLFVIFNVVLAYALIAMWVFRDFTHLGVLIVDIVGQILLYAIYCAKAYKGKQQEEQLKFEKEKLFFLKDEDSEENNESNDAVG